MDAVRQYRYLHCSKLGGLVDLRDMYVPLLICKPMQNVRLNYYETCVQPDAHAMVYIVSKSAHSFCV